MNWKCDSLDCKRRGSDNATGDLPFIAPMKTEHLKQMIQENKQRGGVALGVLVFLTLFVFASGTAQLKDQKHVTAIQMRGAAEGSRVTVVSDSPLLDYEAFRRGDRFYVKIPLADFSSAAPHFHADGFEDVQVQKVGDSLIVSFKLQPGATARVDQHGNQLDVVFTAANRSSFNNAAAGSNPQPNTDRGRAAGPTPPDPAASRPRVVTDGAGTVNESRAPGDPRWPGNPKTNSNKNSNKAGNNQLTTGMVATASPSPYSSPSSSFSPGPATSYQPLTTTTPTLSSSSSPTSSSSSSQSSSNWRNRMAVARQWMSANRLATLLGALILLSLIAYLVMASRRRQTNVVKTQRAKAPKVQAKYSPDAGLNELPRAGSKEQSSSAAAAPSQDQPWMKPSIVSPAAGEGEQVSEEEEREVFEL